MLIDKESMNKIKDFGLNSYESKLWVALLSRGVSTAGELSDISNVPRSRTYDVLESLEKKGFIVMKLGKPIRYMALPPGDVLERVKKHIAEDAESKRRFLDSLKGSEILSRLDTLHTKGVDLVDPLDRTGSFRGRDKMYEHLNTMIKNADKSVWLFTTEAGLARKGNLLRNALNKAAKKGVEVNIAAPITSKNKESAERLSKFANVKNAKNASIRMCKIDDR